MKAGIFDGGVVNVTTRFIQPGLQSKFQIIPLINDIFTEKTRRFVEMFDGGNGVFAGSVSRVSFYGLLTWSAGTSAKVDKTEPSAVVIGRRSSESLSYRPTMVR